MDEFPYYTNTPEPSCVKRKRQSQRQSKLLLNSSLETTDKQPEKTASNKPKSHGQSKQSALLGDAVTVTARSGKLPDFKHTPETRGVKRRRISQRQAMLLVDSEPAPKRPLSCASSRDGANRVTGFSGTFAFTSVSPPTGQQLQHLDREPVPKKPRGRPKSEALSRVQETTPSEPSPSGNQLTTAVTHSSQIQKHTIQTPLQVDSNLPSTSGTPTKKKRGRPKSQRRTKIPAATIGKPLTTEPLLFPLVDSCQKCGARRILYESRTFCCGDGTVVLPTNPYPPQLMYLFTSTDERAVHFQKYSRIYNNVFAYSSIGGDIDVISYKGIYVFKLHGQIYHHVPDLLPNNTGPRYLQLYFYDGQHEAERRAGCLPELRRDVVDILMEITSTNPHAKFFRSLREMDIEENTKIVINKNVGRDQRVHNCDISSFKPFLL